MSEVRSAKKIGPALPRDGSGVVVLAGDVGGTKTQLGLFLLVAGRPEPLVIETHPSTEFRNLEQILGPFMSRHRVRVTSACFGVAGPVHKGVCKTTNLPWVVSEERIRRKFNWPHVRLINDLVAIAMSLPLLKRREWAPLNKARSPRGQNIVLLAPGTGLGEALLVFDREDHVPLASEGGHVDFAPRDEEEIELWRYLRGRFDHVSPERILSGPGLVNIYSWLKSSGRYEEPDWLRDAFEGADPGRVITETALENGHELCTESLRIFVSILGGVAGNLALTGTAKGGVYLGGGIPPKILPLLKGDLFMQAFIAKGRFTDYLKDVPVRVILNPGSALLGAAQSAFRLRAHDWGERPSKHVHA